MMPKYELTDETMEFEGRTLYRIRALREFLNCGSKIEVGDRGGWVESEDNLSHDGGCWLSNNAKAIAQSRVEGNARIRQRSIIRDSAIVSGYTSISDDAVVGGNAVVTMGFIERNAVVAGEVIIDQRCVLGRDAYVTSNTDFITMCWDETPLTLYLTSEKEVYSMIGHYINKPAEHIISEYHCPDIPESERELYKTLVDDFNSFQLQEVG